MLSRLLRRLRRAFSSKTIRVWRLGSLEHRIPADPKAIDRLAELLAAASEGQDLDIVWGPDIDVLEMRGVGEINVVTGPGVRVTREGDVVKIETEPAAP